MLVTGSQLNCSDPFGQRKVAAVYNHIGGQGSMMPTVSALVAAIAIEFVAVLMTACRANKSLCPFDKYR